MPVANPLQTSLDPWAQREAEITRQQAYIDMLRKQGFAQPQGRMAGRFFVPPSILERLVPVLDRVQAGMTERQLAEDRSKLGTDMAQDASDWMTAMPRETTKELAGPTQDGSPLMQTIRPTLEQQLQWAQRGTQNPLSRTLAQQYMKDTLIDAPIRQQAAKDKADEAARARADQAAMRLFEIEQRMQDRTLTREQQAQLAQQANDLRRDIAEMQRKTQLEIAHMSDATRRDIANQNNQLFGKLFGPKDQTTYEDAKSNIDILGTAIDSINKMPDDWSTGIVPGLVQNYVPGGQAMIQNARSAPTNNAVQQVMYIADGIRHERFGTALTATEKASASQYLPNEYDDKKSLARKAQGLQQLLILNNQRLEARRKAAGVPDSLGQPSVGLGYNGTPQLGISTGQQTPGIRRFNPATGKLE